MTKNIDNVEGMIVTSLKMSTCSRSYRPLTNATQDITEYIDLNPMNESSKLISLNFLTKFRASSIFTWDCLLHRTGRSGDLRALPAIQKLSIMTFVLGRSAKLKKKMRIDLDITQGGSTDCGTSPIARFRLSRHNLGVELSVSPLKHFRAR